MSNFSYKDFYRRHLPHIQPTGTTLFVTFRLAGSLPAAVVERLREEVESETRRMEAIADPEQRAREMYIAQKRAFGRWDQALDTLNGPLWLGEPAVAKMTADALHYRHPQVYRLDAFCIMPNHVHVVFSPAEGEGDNSIPLQKIMHSLKRFTASEANELLGRQGQFWQHESYDHYIRDNDEWVRVINYVLNNPVKAGLVESWDDWPWTYLSE